MNNLLKMEKYQLSHNIFYWCGLIGIFLIGFFTADTYVPEAMGPMGGAATSLADIFNGMVYDSTFLLIIISSILALIFRTGIFPVGRLILRSMQDIREKHFLC